MQRLPSLSLICLLPITRIKNLPPLSLYFSLPNHHFSPLIFHFYIVMEISFFMWRFWTIRYVWNWCNSELRLEESLSWAWVVREDGLVKSWNKLCKCVGDCGNDLFWCLTDRRWWNQGMKLVRASRRWQKWCCCCWDIKLSQKCLIWGISYFKENYHNWLLKHVRFTVWVV
jgi:hypothetical protein